MAVRAEMGPTTGEHDAADGGAADAAGLSFAAVDAMLHLEKPFAAFGVDVIGDRGTTGADGGTENRAQGSVKAGELVASESSGALRGPDAGPEETFVGVDVADTVEEGLIEQGGFDGELAAAKESDEVVEGDGERLGSRPLKFDGREGEATEAAGINKAELAAGSEMQDGVGVRRLRRLGMSDEQSARHAEVHDPLESSVGVGGRDVQIEDDVFANAANAPDAAMGESDGHFVGWCFERLRIA